MNAKELTPFQDVRLGPLVGKGSFGKVYRGIWHDMIVAIKVSNPARATRPMSILHRLCMCCMFYNVCQYQYAGVS